MPLRFYPLASLIFAFFSVTAHAALGLAPLFTDHAILQREKPVPVWGTADVGEVITVDFAGHSVTTAADSAGKWRVDLPALAASAEPRTMVIKGAAEVVTLCDILVGEVWLASGQSNMEFWLEKTLDADLETPASGNFPLVREFKVAHAVAETPAATVKGEWKTNGPGTVGRFSAVAYFFARDLALQLRVPVGVVCSTWGGTYVECWISAKSLKSSKYSALVDERWAKTLADYPAATAKYKQDYSTWSAAKASAASERRVFSDTPPVQPAGPGHRLSPAGLYNGMIAPLAPYAWRGVIWYQGESNADRPGEYHDLFTAMITDWRTAFGQGPIPFFWVQLPNFRAGNNNGTAWAVLRNAQSQALSLPFTAQAVTIDLGSETDVHPRNKAPVGRRLARLALHRTYGLDLIDQGPVLNSATRNGPHYQVRFLNVAKGLETSQTELSGFELAGNDRVFHPANAKIEGADTVILSSEEVPDPVAARYAWRNAPVAGLYNSAGLPTEPFRTDDW